MIVRISFFRIAVYAAVSVSALVMSRTFVEALSRMTISDFYTYYYVPKLVFTEKLFPYQNLVPLYPYFFPPASFFLWLPLIYLPFFQAKVVWAFFNLILAFLTAYFLSRIFEDRLNRFFVFAAAVAAFGFSHPFSFTLKDGQFNIVLLFIVAGSYYLSLSSSKPKEVAAGILLGIGTVTKISPFLLLLYLLLKRRYLIFLSGILLCAFLSLASGAFLAKGINKYFVFSVVKNISVQAGDQGYTDQSINAFLKRIEFAKSGVKRLGNVVGLDKNTVYSAFNYLIVFVLLSIFWKFKGRETNRFSEVLRYSILVVVGVLGTGLTWYHQYTILLFPLLVGFYSSVAQKNGFFVLLTLTSYALMDFNFPRFLTASYPTLAWFFRTPLLFYGAVLLLVILFALLLSQERVARFAPQAFLVNPVYLFVFIFIFSFFWQKPVESHIGGRNKARVENLKYMNASGLKAVEKYSEPFEYGVRTSFDSKIMLGGSFLGVKKEYRSVIADRLSIVVPDPVNNSEYNFTFSYFGSAYTLYSPLEGGGYQRQIGGTLVYSNN